jgi:hypothetical protein
MTLADIMADLEANGTAQTKKTWLRHGAREPIFGVKIEHLKTIQKKVKKNHQLALALYDTGNADAMYLAGLVAEPMKMTKAQLQKWVKAAYWYMLSGYTVPWTASESKFGRELALEWMDSKKEQISVAGWSTYGSLISVKPDDELDLDEIVELLDRVPREIAAAPNRTKYCMNQFVISVAAFVAPLLPKAKAVAKTLGKVHVDMGDTDCKVPEAAAYIAMLEDKGRVGKKRKSAAC